MPLVLDPVDPLAPAFRDSVGRAITGFIEQQRPLLAWVGTEVEPLASLAADFTAGGKRLRPAFCVWGFVAAAGLPSDPEPLITAAASLDLLHVSALVHDDVMDASDTRRGVPAAHRQLERLHADRRWRGGAEEFGRAGAILLGDLLTMWSAQMVRESGIAIADLDRALPILEAMRSEVTLGQFLDVVSQAQQVGRTEAELAIDEANRVVEFKSARYTVQRPAQFGAALGRADERLLAALAGYGSPLGRAFQFRDDILGVFGDEELTGKPAGDDLREGKRTLLLAHALDAASPAAVERLVALVGDPALDAAGVDEARGIIDESGARDSVEAMIDQGLTAALAALDGADLHPEGRHALEALAHLAVHRDR